MVIEVLGPGCSKCERLEEMVRKAAGELDLACEIVHVRDIAEIVGRGVSSLPGLIIDGQVVVSGRLPTDSELNAWLRAALP